MWTERTFVQNCYRP